MLHPTTDPKQVTPSHFEGIALRPPHSSTVRRKDLRTSSVYRDLHTKATGMATAKKALLFPLKRLLFTAALKATGNPVVTSVQASLAPCLRKSPVQNAPPTRVQ